MGHVDFEGLSERLFNGFEHKLYLKQIWIITIISPPLISIIQVSDVFFAPQIADGHRFFSHTDFSDCTDCWSLDGSCHAGCFAHQSSSLATTIIRNPKNLCEKNAWQDRTSVSICVICGAKDTPKVKSIITWIRRKLQIIKFMKNWLRRAKGSWLIHDK